MNCKKQQEVYEGPNSLRCIKILSECNPFLSFLFNPFSSCKDTFVDDYDGILVTV